MKAVKTLLALAITALASTAALADIKIGVSLALTGPGSGLGIPDAEPARAVPQDHRRREDHPGSSSTTPPTRARARPTHAASSPKTRST